MRTFMLTCSMAILSASCAWADKHTHKENQETSDELCLASGPQTPRDISNSYGLNEIRFPVAPPANEMNLCNIHTHTNAEHKGPGYRIFVNASDQGGYRCNATDQLTEAELAPAPGAYKGVKPGDTIECALGAHDVRRQSPAPVWRHAFQRVALIRCFAWKHKSFWWSTTTRLWTSRR